MSATLHGSAPDTHAVALLPVDVINPLDFPGADHLLQHATRGGQKAPELKQRARKARVPVVYANDNCGVRERQLRALAVGPLGRRRAVPRALRWSNSSAPGRKITSR